MGSPLEQDQLEVLRTTAEVEQVRNFWTSLPAHRDADIDFYLLNMELLAGVIRPHIIAIYSKGQPKALVIGRLESRPLEVGVGYWRFRTSKLQTLTFIHPCIVGELSELDSILIVKSIMNSLRAGEAVVAKFEALKTDSPLLTCAKTIPGFFYSDHFSNATVHYVRDLNLRTKSLLESLSSNTRHNFKRSAKRFLEAFPGQVRIDHFDRVADVDRLMEIAEFVATKSYQRGLGVGFTSSPEVRQQLEFEARKGWLRAYVLCIENKPCAFWIGSLYRGTFYSDFIGYDPQYAKNSPGMYLVVNALIELSKEHAEGNSPDIDFGAGQGLWKETLSSRNWDEAPVYIFAPTLPGAMLNVIRSALAVVNQQAKAWLIKANLLTRVKKLWRAKR